MNDQEAHEPKSEPAAPPESAAEEQPAAPRQPVRTAGSPAERLTRQPAREGAEAGEEAEGLLWVGRTSWKHFIGAIAAWVIGGGGWAVLIGWLASRFEGFRAGVAFWVGFVPIAAGGLWLAAKLIRGVYGHRYRLSDERLFIDRGLFSQTIDQTELIRVDDVRVHKSFINRLLGIGSVEVISTDVTDSNARIVGVAQAEDVAEGIRSRMRAMRKQHSLYVDRL